MGPLAGPLAPPKDLAISFDCHQRLSMEARLRFGLRALSGGIPDAHARAHSRGCPRRGTMLPRARPLLLSARRPRCRTRVKTCAGCAKWPLIRDPSIRAPQPGKDGGRVASNRFVDRWSRSAASAPSRSMLQV